jgi:hypothetical protein
MHMFEKVNSKTFFHKFTQWFVDRTFSNLWKPTINKIFETLKTILCNSKRASLVATWFKEQSFKTTDALSNDNASPKTMRCVW